MIEVIYKEEKTENDTEERLFSIPRNIRQIGFTGGNSRIYIEDYVYTFLGRLAGGENRKESGTAAVFTGEIKWNDGITYVFIRGAIMLDDSQVTAEHIDFSEEVWAKIQEQQSHYFTDQEIVGWFFARPQLYLETNELLTKIHLRYFGGEKVLMLMEPIEREDAFFCYENGYLTRQRGYYIYYEKNTQMQDYMIEKNKEFSSETTENAEDEAVQSFRKIINKKKEKTEENLPQEQEKPSVFSYAATACLILAIFATGAGIYRNYRSYVQKQAEATVSVISDKADADELSENVSPTAAAENQEWEATVSPAPAFYDSQEQQESLENQENEQAQAEQGAETSELARKEPQDYTQSQTVAAEEDYTTQQEEKWTTEDQTGGGNGSQDQVILDETGEEVQDENTVNVESDERKAKRRTETEAAGTLAENQTQETSSDKVHETYMIKPGDTLYEISLSHYGNMDAIAEICSLNNLTENQVIYPGQVIVLP